MQTMAGGSRSSSRENSKSTNHTPSRNTGRTKSPPCQAAVDPDHLMVVVPDVRTGEGPRQDHPSCQTFRKLRLSLVPEKGAVLGRGLCDVLAANPYAADPLLPGPLGDFP